jgi:hypothetical protein
VVDVDETDGATARNGGSDGVVVSGVGALSSGVVTT